MTIIRLFKTIIISVSFIITYNAPMKTDLHSRNSKRLYKLTQYGLVCNSLIFIA